MNLLNLLNLAKDDSFEHVPSLAYELLFQRQKLYRMRDFKERCGFDDFGFVGRVHNWQFEMRAI